MKFSRNTGPWGQLAAVEPEYIFAAIIVLGVLIPVDDHWGILTEVALLPLCAWMMIRHGFGRSRSAVFMWLPVTWIAWLGASGGWGTESAFDVWDHSSLAALMTAMFFVMSVIFIQVASRPFLNTVGAGLALAATATMVSGIVGHALSGELASARLSGLAIFDKQNLGSFAAVFIALIALHLARTSRNRIRWLLLLCPVVTFVHILLAGSRGGLLVFPAVMGGYVLFHEPRSGLRILTISGVALAALIAVAVVLVPGAEEFLLRTLERQTYRVEIWQDAWARSQSRLALGHGWGDGTTFATRSSHPHNLHLSNLFYAGLPALALGLSVVAAAVLLALSITERSSRVLASAAAALVILSTFAHGSLPISKPDVLWYSFWAPLALVWGLACRSEEQRC